ncbi:MAG TPA: saccharopine dehydrogenase NADP-binding domain-containing protein [Xanthomonadales bacterium]|nr:saccharopine dehydrogenase NADP-binding domain-containing protein [Xanthomonadales bacterium]
MNQKQWMIYGANGYTGRLTALEAARRGMNPILAGRNAAALAELAKTTGFETRVFSLDSSAEVVENIGDCHLVLHCAGPFSATSQPMIAACLAASVHYLDITGEISVFANAHKQADAARHADVVLIPGVGFDVVPSDCLAASLVQALPAAIELCLAFEAGGGPSPGTAKTSTEGLAKGGTVRKEGKLTAVPLAWKSRTIPFAHGERMAMTIPWGDVFTAYVSTGVPDIEVYMSVPPATIKRLQRMRWIQPLLGTSMVQNFMKKRIARSVKGPDDSRREKTSSQLWGQVRSADGRTVSGTMTTPNGYDLTVIAGLGIVEYLLQNDVEGGYYTPSTLVGADYAQGLPGVTMAIGPVLSASESAGSS